MLGLFYQMAPAAAATIGGGAQPTTAGSFMTFLPIIIMVVFMYLLVFLPDNKRRKKLQKQIDGLKQGDRIITLGHIVGTVEFIGEKTIYIKSQDSKIEVSKSGVASVLDNGKLD
ncbi:MAG: preprotein translocase subunit YajC [Spirochaetota bacterium]|nr:preprotein translocase subunit YajC [Spirochaetota bacterium]